VKTKARANAGSRERSSSGAQILRSNPGVLASGGFRTVIDEDDSAAVQRSSHTFRFEAHAREVSDRHKFDSEPLTGYSLFHLRAIE
jgi:hypothetical protein